MLKAALAFLVLMTEPAMAFDQTFLGTWAPDAAACADADSTVRFMVTAKKLEGREFACKLKRASRVGSDWRVHYSCIGEGEAYSRNLKWRLGANGHLVEQADGETTEYMRCGGAKAPDAATRAAADDFAGKYAGSKDTYEWDAVITPKGGQSYSVHIGVSSSKPACIGETEAVGRLQGGRIVTHSGDPDDACVLVISKSGNGIDVEEKRGCQDHGAACTFTSRMKRVAW
ncbi:MULTISPECIES: hypothetical protein [unclassified Mesorhizobium]|uniref:hypothetical protein n=1 Tax=unclassified Mesorhizobium TaxID=325217 RepID=UPI001127C50A|nr:MULTISPECIES: hypothetical protein [unclassified Mesorhizobium]MBZ9985445.1 hypothetical protein [Mesorhizobium sp. BR-1-1-8]TPL25786.1 hypothetical protein FJ947_30480 [Mesorhizobium sp. B2-4-8]TPL58051.1 hypothetical protein FJ949_29580 [Mesorhizobium sp. B2-4-1]TPM88435.1 hypothetical protein FJ966_30700 [Mesorhizobium sp. B2-1-5]